MSIRLTKEDKREIASLAAWDSISESEKEVSEEMYEVASKVYESVVPASLEATFEGFPEGIMTKSEELMFETEDLGFVYLRLREGRYLPARFLPKHVRDFSNLKLSKNLRESTSSVMKKRLALEKLEQERFDKIFALVDESSTLSGLLTKFPDFVKYLPDRLRDELPRRKEMQEILTSVGKLKDLTK